MSQTRIVLNEKHKPTADKILEQTGISNFSELFGILLTCYGERLIASLKGDNY
jgi:hypothetical protein